MLVLNAQDPLKNGEGSPYNRNCAKNDDEIFIKEAGKKRSHYYLQ